MFEPGIGLVALILLFGAFSVADGVLSIVMAVSSRREEPRWWLPLAAGLLRTAVGVAAFVVPGLTALALLYLIAASAVVGGAIEIAAAIRLRKQISGEWLLALAGVLSVAFGVLVAVFPGPGALAIVLWIGAYATVVGVLLLALAFRVRRWTRAHHGVPTPRTA
jgi:uncharacterized membrane protein HdeD (DUF308 family)